MKPGASFGILWAALCAAVGSTWVELLLWWLHGDDAVRNLYRDARLTAAIVMGRRVLGPPAGFEPLVMGMATLVHFALSLAYTAVLAVAIHRLSLLVGAVFGLLLYGINLYGFTEIFPWFVPVRGAITLAAHLAFGITAAATYRLAGWSTRRRS
ncbi:hypothetical protein [Burkholderia ubonensis]|uniref:hypothetical protein n=1 Tax=Burkholderia ubonensis TaxID=101571 RepID=UPI00075FCC6E|nr:hypothetical protein [Burkholderia ubonensis]KWI73990.1 sodium:proline symporter [Burkholderia ubonensis]